MSFEPAYIWVLEPYSDSFVTLTIIEKSFWIMSIIFGDRRLSFHFKKEVRTEIEIARKNTGYRRVIFRGHKLDHS